MIQKTETVFICDKHPFFNCKLNREIIADNLTQIIETLHGSFTIGIDSPWGTGKSTFIKMWQKKLELEKSEGIFTIYFNAWENDFHGEVLLALIGELDKLLENNENVTNDDLKKILGSIGSNITSWATRGMVNPKELYRDLNSTEERKLFNKYKEYNNLKESIKNNLREIKTKLGVKKVIFFIDELDRCRPNYAVETLEKLKHLFEVEDYIFVLALDKEQLSHSVSTIYGEGMDSIGYLRRFIDMDYTLPKPNKNSFLNFLFDKHTLADLTDSLFYFKRIIIGYAKENNTSLRDLEKLMYQARLIAPLIILSSEKSEDFYFIKGTSYAFFLCLKFFEPNTYNKILSKEILQPEESLKIINLAKSWVNCHTEEGKYDNGTSSLIKKILLLNTKFDSNNTSFNIKLGNYKANHTVTIEINNILFDSNKELKVVKDIEFLNDFNIIG